MAWLDPSALRSFVKNLNADDEEMINKRVGANVSDVNAFRLLKA